LTVVATTGAAVVVTACVFTITCGTVVSFAGAGLAEVVTTGAFVEAAAIAGNTGGATVVAIAGNTGGTTVVATAGSLALSTAVSFLTAATGT